ADAAPMMSNSTAINHSQRKRVPSLVTVHSRELSLAHPNHRIVQRGIKLLTRPAEAMIARLDEHILLRVPRGSKQRRADLLRTRRVGRTLDHHQRHGRNLR